MMLNKEEKLRMHIDRAETALAADQFEAAWDCVKKAIAIAPDSSDARLLEARIDLQLDQPEFALAALDAHDQYHPDACERPDVSLLRVRALVRVGQDALANMLLERLIRRYPDDVRWRRLMTGLCMKHNKHGRAAHQLRRTVELETSDRASRNVLAGLVESRQPQLSAELLMNEHDRATDELTDEIAPVALRAARLYRKAGRQGEAERLYRQLLSVGIDDAVVWREAGEVAGELGADRVAEFRIERAIKLSGPNARQVDHEKANAWASMALVQMHAGRFEEAGRCWWKVTRARVDDTNAWAGLKVCGLVTGRHRLVDRAGTFLAFYADEPTRRRAVADQWIYASCGLEIGRAIGRRGKYQTTQSDPLESMLHRSIDKLERSARQEPYDAELHHHIAICHHALGDDETAVLANTSALMIDPHYDKALDFCDYIDGIAA